MPAAHSPDAYSFVILGGAGGIGSAVAERLVARGWNVTIAGRTAATVNETAARLGIRGAVVDATDSTAVEACLGAAREAHGSLNGVANCVGSLLLKPAHLTTDAEFNEVIRTNLGSAFATVSAAARVLESGSSVVLVASAAALAGFANHEAIAAAKAGVIGLMQSAAASYATRNIRFNAVAPGLVRTPMTARLTQSDASLKASESMHALGRIGEPAHVASMIEWLLDPANDWTTGQVIAVDGGLSSVRPRTKG